ncbi:MAG: hypothetical protein QT03_C0001G0852 [archaeon GW2011_AR10]|nr:MAG: hypothetical protein QT03_C0001G0852 [archaeon GW2011_AR10]
MPLHSGVGTKMSLKQIFLLLISTLALASFANAFYVGYTDSDFYFEIYSGENYGFVDVPYSYYYEDWYYFDYPYRVNYFGNYYYYEPGWYQYSPSYWNYDPYAYSYYATDYYFYGGAWTYYPGWTTVYAPTYYGHYYYPPVYFYNTFTVGAPYDYPQEASCSELSINANNVSIEAGKTKTVEVSVFNDSRKNFKVNSVNVHIDGFEVTAKNIEFSETIYSKFSGKVQFELAAEEGSPSKELEAEVRINGEFADSTNCSGKDASDTFTINIKGNEATPATGSINSGNSAASQFETNYSTSFIVPRENSWREVASTETIPNTNDFPTRNSLQLGSLTFEPLKGNCNGIGLVVEPLSVKAKEARQRDFYLKNFSNADFIIDSVTATEAESFFSISAERIDSMVYSDNMARVRVHLLGGNTAEDEVGKARLTVKGHFDSGISCTESKEFEVYVDASFVAAGPEKFELTVPEKAELNGSGFVRIKADNPSNETAVIRMDAGNAIVSPSSITVGPRSLVERVIAVNGFDSDEELLVYSIEIPGALHSQKYTKLVKISEEAGSEGGIKLLSYTSMVEIKNGKGVLSVVVENNSGKAEEVKVRLTDLPQGFTADSSTVELSPRERRTVALQLESENEKGNFNAVLLVESESRVFRRNIELVVVEAEEQQEGQGVVEGLVGTAFAVLEDNALGIALGFVILVILILLYKIVSIDKRIIKKEHTWISYRNQ